MSLTGAFQKPNGGQNISSRQGLGVGQNSPTFTILMIQTVNPEPSLNSLCNIAQPQISQLILAITIQGLTN